MSNAKRYEPSTAPSGVGLKGLLLYVLPMPTLIAALSSLLNGNVLNTLITGGAFFGYMVTASVARHGFKLEAEYNKRQIARPPSTPYKTIAAIFLAVITTGLDWWTSGFSMSGLVGAGLLGAAAFLGFALYYGLDPRKTKAGNISIGVTVEEVLAALDAANIKIEAIDNARRHINNPDFNMRLQRITQKAREVLTSIEEDPTRLARARKFLKVYLEGTQQVTEGYARTHKDLPPAALETNFSRVLDSIEQTFNEQQVKLLEDKQFDLDVQIEVLETQLKREGVL